MNLAHSLRLMPFTDSHYKFPEVVDSGICSKTIALIGSGGKTTALFQLARELPPPVIVTSTTHLHIDQVHLSDTHLIVANSDVLNDLDRYLRGVTLITGPQVGDRMTGLDDRWLTRLHELCCSHDLPLLIEADGSRQRPLKAPADHEPLIPPFVDLVIVLCGLSGLGKPLSKEIVHRPEIFAALSGLHMGDRVTSEALAHLLNHPSGGLKNIPPQARRMVCLNQADTPELILQGKQVVGKVLPAYHGVMIASLKNARVLAVFELIAGIILAAGESSRFGQPKQLLEWDGKPFIRAVAETAVHAGLSPVVVVTGSNAEQVEPALDGLSVTIVRNSEWREGQSSSIRVALRSLQVNPSREVAARRGLSGGWDAIGAAIFLLADQPQVSSTILRSLCELHTITLAPIIAPLVRDRRANPVLFDRVTFPELLTLRGDVGGRAIFHQYPIEYLTWHDERLLSDIDTPEEYQKLVGGV
jgi:molybdenum cofactor cytidylyltransferase